jgi:hypothetical protein
MWLAEAVTPGQLVRLEHGRDRLAVAEHLLAIGDEVAIGLDFGFSFPGWFLSRLPVSNAPDLWAHVATHGEAWLSECQAPFWGRRGRPRPLLEGPAFRRAELAVPRPRGIGPKSMFQIGGAGAVGTGSIRGMPLLHRMHQVGATIWPFVTGGWPVVVEIYPRLLTGGVRKANAAARRAHLAERRCL